MRKLLNERSSTRSCARDVLFAAARESDSHVQSLKEELEEKVLVFGRHLLAYLLSEQKQ